MERKGIDHEIVNKENMTFQDFYDKHRLLDGMIEREIVVDYLLRKGYIKGEGASRNVSIAKPTQDSYVFHLVDIEDENLEKLEFELM